MTGTQHPPDPSGAPPSDWRALAAFAELQETLGAPPTLRELANKLDESPSHVYAALTRLHAQGYLQRPRLPGTSRGYRLARHPDTAVDQLRAAVRASGATAEDVALLLREMTAGVTP